MENTTLYPVSIYRYKRHVATDGSTGTRWDYLGHEGQEYPELVRTLIRKPDTGCKIVYHGMTRHPKTRELVLALWRGKDKSTGDKGWLSQVYEPGIKKPGLGFGDLGNRADAALLIRRDEQSGTLTIMVFPGHGKEPQAQVLYNQWPTGGIRESLASNNVKLNNTFCSTCTE